jgi:hypothetical protein
MVCTQNHSGGKNNAATGEKFIFYAFMSLSADNTAFMCSKLEMILKVQP